MVFNSVYEMITPPHVLKKSWFVDYFDGDQLNDWWSIGAGTFEGLDAIDGGLKMTGAGNNWLLFGAKRHYEETGCVFEAITTAVDITSTTFTMGGTNTGGITGNLIYAGVRTSTSANFTLESRNGGTTSTGGSTTADLNSHRHKIELFSSNAKYTLDGILDVTMTTNLPAARMQPLWFGQAVQNGASIRYFEAYNT